MEKVYSVIIISLVGIIAFSCNPKKQTQHIKKNQAVVRDNGNWNNSDSRLVSDELIKELLHDNWINDYKTKNPGKRPILVVGFVKKNSLNYIDTNTFIKNIERAIIQDGSGRLIQVDDKRESLGINVTKLQDNEALEMIKEWGVKLGAEYLIQGDINSLIETSKKEKLITYQVNLELFDLKINEVIWRSEKQVKKVISL